MGLSQCRFNCFARLLDSAVDFDLERLFIQTRLGKRLVERFHFFVKTVSEMQLAHVSARSAFCLADGGRHFLLLARAIEHQFDSVPGLAHLHQFA